MEGFADTDMNIVTDDSTFHLWSKAFTAGPVTLGGNVHPGKKVKGVSQYFVVLQPKPLTPLGKITSIEDALAVEGNKDRGEGLFFAQAGCANCHRIGERGTNFGPDLTNLRERVEARFMAQSILDPNAVITEGFAAHTVDADGKNYFGILLEEDKKMLTLGLADGSRVKLAKKGITKHETLATSPMPPFAATLSPQNVADLIAFLSHQSQVGAPPPPAVSQSRAGTPVTLAFQQHGDVLDLMAGEVVLAGYHTRSEIIKRPFFANVRSTSGRAMTRPFPVTKSSKNGGDHADMHPGIWLGFGDINGSDFWRNKGRIEHVKFTEEPAVKDNVASFGTLNRLVDAAGKEVARQTISARMQPDSQGWRMHIESDLWSEDRDLNLGAQEEMGLGIRLAPDLIEKAGGIVRNSLGDTKAKSAWGKVAAWWDYGRDGSGILAVPDPANPLPCWGHTRDYGVMVLNPTPRETASQQTLIKQGSHLHLKFDVLVHDSATGFVLPSK
jgi:putative heme-binding domain-containing protein